MEDEGYNDIQRQTHSRLLREVNKRQRQRDHDQPARFGFDEVITTAEPEGYEEV